MAGKTVTIGCKLPQGLTIRHGGSTVKLAGANSSRIVGGFGMTQVDEDLAKAWFDARKNFAPVARGLIFIQASDARAQSEANEKKDLASGFEGISQDKPAAEVTKVKEED